MIASGAIMIAVGLLFVLLAFWRLGKRKAAVKSAENGAPPPPDPGTAASAVASTAHPTAAVTSLSLFYVAFMAWMFVAWYRAHKPLSRYRFGGDGWLGVTTYAGGADKFGHAWATMALARLGTWVLTDIGGYRRGRASLVSAGMSELLFTGVEVRDGTFYEFSFSDLTGDSVGMVLALLFDNFPRFRELFAFRVQYFPSLMYVRKMTGASPCPMSSCSSWNIAEDYSGQTYITALHLAGIKAIRNKVGTVSRFVDLGMGFRSRNYRPTPDRDVAEPIRQDLYAALSFNAQGFFDWVFEQRTSRAARRAHKITHGLFEVFNLPYSSIKLFGGSREGPIRAVKEVPSSYPPPELPSGSGSSADARSWFSRARSRA